MMLSLTEQPAADCGGKCDSPTEADALELCVGVRGNGPRITSHFAAMARIIEHYGLVDAVAGGSSGSITSFLLESVQANPAIYDCDGTRCDEHETVARAALLCKTDLVTEMIRDGKEFTSLQGIMGREYAKRNREPDDVAQALEEQYLPRFAGDALPATTAGAYVAIGEPVGWSGLLLIFPKAVYRAIDGGEI